MTVLSKKIDFAVVFSVGNANPNGDPLSGNRPRTDIHNYGEVSDVCIKRKIRNSLMYNGEEIFVQSDDCKNDEAKSLKDRLIKVLKIEEMSEDLIERVCGKWIDVRAFGQVFAYKGKDKGKGVSIGIRGPVSIQSAFSAELVEIVSKQITKSVNNEDKDKKGSDRNEDKDKKGSDTMGMKHCIKYGVYVFKGAMNPQLAEKTGFSDEDAEKIKLILPKLFENDASSARPEGSMEILEVVWWEHNSKSGQYSSAEVHRSLEVVNNEKIVLKPLENLHTEEWNLENKEKKYVELRMTKEKGIDISKYKKG